METDDEDSDERAGVGFEEFDEPIGACDECGGNVYEDEAFEIDDSVYCDQCAWWLLASAAPEPAP